MENKTWIIVLGILVVCSMAVNISLLFAIGDLSYAWEEEYEDSSIKFCERSNDYSEVINDLIIELSFYDDEYSDIDLLSIIDCFN